MVRARSTRAANGREAVPSVAELLALWRATREPRIADVLDAIAKSTPMPRLPSTKQADLKRWCAWARKRTIDELPALLAALDQVSSAGRLAELDRWEPDPRIGRFAVMSSERLRAWSDRDREQTEHRALFALIVKHADAAIADRFDELARRRLAGTGYVTSTEWYDRESALVAAQLRENVRPSDLAVQQRCDAWLAALRHEPTEKRGALFAAVYATPTDDRPRAVLADELQAAGDPHGELIALQLARPTPAIEKRIKALLRKPAVFCAPAVWQMLSVRSVRFERGFIARGMLAPRNKAVWAAGIGAVEWATVHTLDLGAFAGFGRASSELTRMLRFIHDPAMRQLRRVGPINVDEAAALIAHGVPVPWRELAIKTANRREELIDALAGARGVFPAVEHLALEISSAALHRLLDRASWLTELSKLTLARSCDDGAAAARALGIPVATLEPAPITGAVRALDFSGTVDGLFDCEATRG